MASKIKSQCDTRCQYAMDPDGDCDCECGGRNHGQGQDASIREKQQARHNKTRRAFRAYLDEQNGKGAGRKLYRKNRTEFNALFAKWLADNGHEVSSKGMDHTQLEVDGPKYEVIKQSTDGEFKHVRYLSNNKTAYLRNEKVITKAQVPAELGW